MIMVSSILLFAFSLTVLDVYWRFGPTWNVKMFLKKKTKKNEKLLSGFENIEKNHHAVRIQ